MEGSVLRVLILKIFKMEYTPDESRELKISGGLNADIWSEITIESCSASEGMTALVLDASLLHPFATNATYIFGTSPILFAARRNSTLYSRMVVQRCIFLCRTANIPLRDRADT
jgi:hypothetical protein